MSVLANEEKEVYSAYGMTVYCVENENIWSKNHDTVYTAIRIEKAGEDIVDIGLDINYIESAVYAWLIECNNFLNYRIESRKKYGNRSIYSPM